jgi:hypothetical protein
LKHLLRFFLDERARNIGFLERRPLCAINFLFVSLSELSGRALAQFGGPQRQHEKAQKATKLQSAKVYKIAVQSTLTLSGF